MKIGLLTSSPKSYKNSRFVAELKKRGHKPVIINYLHCYCNLSAGQPMVYYEGKALGDLDAIIPQIAVSSTNFGAAIVRQFEMMGVFTIVGSLALLRTRDKIRELQLLSKAGVDIPRTAFAHNSSDAGALVRMVGGAPLVIKVAQGSLGKGVMLAESNASAKSAIEAFFSQSVDILIQEYIEESEGSDIRAFVVDGKVVAAMKRSAAEGEFRSNIYMGGSATPVKLNRAERQLALSAAKIMHLPIAGVDIIQSDRGPLIMEVNACPNMEGIEKSSGLNIVGMIIEYIENSAGKRSTKDKVGA
jgi:ribosomal protein S6--L-glutamate ligase